MKLSRPQWVQITAWSISLIVCIVATIAWGQTYSWQLLPINTYQLFPLLGLLAFSLMWAHYLNGTLRELWGVEFKVLARYFRYTGYAVLVLICLHPGILIYQRFRDGYGLPPHSYETYVGPGLGWITILGTASLLVFLSFELRRWCAKKSWWHFIPEAGDAAMLAIVYHGLRLGSNLQMGWFRSVWFFYAVVLVAVLIRSYTLKLLKPRKKPGV